MLLRDIRERVWRQGERRLVAPSHAAWTAMEALVVEASRAAESTGGDSRALRALLPATGFSAELWQVGPARVLALLDERGRGGGAYFFRVEPAPTGGRARRLLQAPHAYHDVATGKIAASLFFEQGSGDAFFTNTLHRYWSADGPRTPRPNAPADVCQQTGSFFQAATRAFLSRGPARIVQLHGFGDREGGDLDVILSRGEPSGSGPVVARLAARLTAAFSVRVARFPEDTLDLGATTNEQGKLARAVGAEFVHVETSRAFRQRLEDNAALASALGEAIWSPAE